MRVCNIHRKGRLIQYGLHWLSGMEEWKNSDFCSSPVWSISFCDIRYIRPVDAGAPKWLSSPLVNMFALWLSCDNWFEPATSQHRVTHQDWNQNHAEASRRSFDTTWWYSSQVCFLQIKYSWHQTIATRIYKDQHLVLVQSQPGNHSQSGTETQEQITMHTASLFTTIDCKMLAACRFNPDKGKTQNTALTTGVNKAQFSKTFTNGGLCGSVGNFLKLPSHLQKDKRALLSG